MHILILSSILHLGIYQEELKKKKTAKDINKMYLLQYYFNFVV